MDTVYVHKYCIKYWDECDKKMCIERGIAFRDVIICGCCGGTIEISELYDIAEEIELGEDPIKVLNWIDINAEIKGE